jgi:hypothetical protein
MEVIMTKVSTKTKRKNGEILHMFTFVHGKGSNRKSFTRHCTEREANMIKEGLK